MEPFRIIVDKKVKSMALDEFGHDEKMEVLNLLNAEVYIGGKREFVNNAIKLYCRSVFDALNENDPSLIKFYRNEL